jgi:uncharacterized SAM-binding protein YcdF (DUF218 family)
VADLVSFALSTGGFACAVLLGCLWLTLQPRALAPRRALLAVAFLYTLSSVYAISHVMSRALATGYHPLKPGEIDDGPTAIVVLGSGSFTAKDWNESKLSIVDPIAASRVLEAARVYRFVHARWVVSSGGLASQRGERVASGITMRDALVQVGVPSERIIVETDSRNTHDEAVIIGAILTPLHPDHIVLVTSIDHMRRSVGTFRAAGLPVVPSVARDPFAADPWLDWLIPSELGLRQTSSVAHELLGTVYYWLRGWYR